MWIINIWIFLQFLLFGYGLGYISKSTVPAVPAHQFFACSFSSSDGPLRSLHSADMTAGRWGLGTMAIARTHITHPALVDVNFFWKRICYYKFG